MWPVSSLNKRDCSPTTSCSTQTSRSSMQHPDGDVHIMRRRHRSAEVRPQHIVHTPITRITPLHRHRGIVIETEYVFRVLYFNLVSSWLIQSRDSDELRIAHTICIAIRVYLESVIKPHPAKPCTVFMVFRIAVGKTEQLVV